MAIFNSYVKLPEGNRSRGQRSNPPNLRHLLQADEAGAVRVPVDAEGLAIPGRPVFRCPGDGQEMDVSENKASKWPSR